MAFDPASGLLVTNTNRLATVATLLPAREVKSAGYDSAAHVSVARQTPAPYGVKRGALLSPLGIPCTPPPWGMLHAVDTRTGEVRWEVPLGSSLDITKVPVPWQWGSVNLGGPVISGGLVFIAASMDRRIRAFDLATGTLAWEHDLPASAPGDAPHLQGPRRRSPVPGHRRRWARRPALETGRHRGGVRPSRERGIGRGGVVMRALVTGATGMLGARLVERLLGEGWNVRALARDPSRAAWLEAQGARVAAGDLTDPDRSPPPPPAATRSSTRRPRSAREATTRPSAG